MERNNLGNVQVCQLTSRYRLLDRQEMSNLGESVDDDKDGIMTLPRSRKTGDEVHLNLVPFPFRNREWLQSSSRSLMFCLDAMTNVTFINITSNVLLHARPPVPLTNVLVHLGTTRVNRQRGIVSFFHNMRSLVQVPMPALAVSNH